MGMRHDILSRAKRKGQATLIELPSVRWKDNPLQRVKAKREETQERITRVQSEGEMFEYTFEHPELCPPIGAVIFIVSPYGVKAKLTVKMVFRGLPGTSFELLPMSEQPEHLRDKKLLAIHTEGCGRPNWVQWADTDMWNRWQDITKQTTARFPN